MVLEVDVEDVVAEVAVGLDEGGLGGAVGQQVLEAVGGDVQAVVGDVGALEDE